MMDGRYTSFEEIDARLKILKLQREIDLESLKLRLNQAKADLTSRTFLQVVGTLAQNRAWKQLLLALAINKVSGILRRRLRKNSGE